MKRQWNTGWQAVTILLATAIAGVAQVNTPAAPGAGNYPGAVNYVEGQVMLNGQPLSARNIGSTIVMPNQVIGTADGYAELLLTPGAFLRIGHNSEVRLVSAGLAAVDLQVNHGTTLLEAVDLVKGSNIEVAMNGATTRIEQRGLYSFDANQQIVKVLDGKAQVSGAGGAVTLKKGNQTTVAGEQALAKRDFSMDAAKAEPLYVWSKVRSQYESEASVNVANAIAMRGGSYGPGWYWDPFWSGYAFMPGWGILNSPFGWGYYSPGFVYAAPWGYGRGFYGRGYYGGVHGRVGGVGAGVRSFQGGGFHGGGGHGGGRR